MVSQPEMYEISLELKYILTSITPRLQILQNKT